MRAQDHRHARGLRDAARRSCASRARGLAAAVAAAAATARCQAPCASRYVLGARTSSIIRSYDSRARLAEREEAVVEQHHADRCSGRLGSANRSAHSRARSKPGITYGDHDAPSRRRSRATRCSPVGVLVIASSASAWVWSTNVYGRIACRIVSTDGVGADGVESSPPAARCTISRVGEARRASASAEHGSSRTGAKPGASIVSRSQPLPLT